MTIERNFENILRLKSNQKNFWTEKNNSLPSRPHRVAVCSLLFKIEVFDHNFFAQPD